MMAAAHVHSFGPFIMDQKRVQGGISVLKAVDRYLRKFRLKSGANQVDLGKAAETAVDLYEHCTLVLFNGTK